MGAAGGFRLSLLARHLRCLSKSRLRRPVKNSLPYFRLRFALVKTSEPSLFTSCVAGSRIEITELNRRFGALVAATLPSTVLPKDMLSKCRAVGTTRVADCLQCREYELVYL